MSDVYDQGALTQELQRQQSSAATNAVSQVSSVPPAAASQAIVAQKQTGLPARTTMFDPASSRGRDQAIGGEDRARVESGRLRPGSPSADPAHVAAAQDDLPGLAKIAEAVKSVGGSPLRDFLSSRMRSPISPLRRRWTYSDLGKIFGLLLGLISQALTTFASPVVEGPLAPFIQTGQQKVADLLGNLPVYKQPTTLGGLPEPTPKGPETSAQVLDALGTALSALMPRSAAEGEFFSREEPSPLRLTRERFLRNPFREGCLDRRALLRKSKRRQRRPPIPRLIVHRPLGRRAPPLVMTPIDPLLLTESRSRETWFERQMQRSLPMV